MSDLQLLFNTNPGQLAEQRRIRSVEDMFKQQQEARAAADLELRRGMEARLAQRDRENADIQRRELGIREREFAARLPTLEAESKIKAKELELKEKKQPYDIDAIVTQNQARLTKEKLEKMNNAGTAVSQAAQLLRFNDIGAAKKHLEDAGYGNLWNPSWDTIDPKNWQTLSGELERFGEGLSKSSQSFLQKQSLQDDAQEAKRLLEETRARNARELEAVRAERKSALAQQLAAMRRDADAQKSPKTFQELAVRIQERARNESDPEIKAMLQQEASKYLEAAQSLAAVPSGKPTIDPNIAPGVLVPPPQRSNPLGPTGPSALPQNPAVMPSQGSPAQQRGGNTVPNVRVPPGRVIIYKDGKPAGHIPESQMEEAMKQGFSLRPM